MNHIIFLGLNEEDKISFRRLSKDVRLAERGLLAQDILTYCCDINRVSIESVLSKKRHRIFSDTRKIICYLLYSRLNYHEKYISELIGVDRATVYHHSKTFKALVDYDEKFQHNLKMAEEKFNL